MNTTKYKDTKTGLVFIPTTLGEIKRMKESSRYVEVKEEKAKETKQEESKKATKKE